MPQREPKLIVRNLLKYELAMKPPIKVTILIAYTQKKVMLSASSVDAML